MQPNNESKQEFGPAIGIFIIVALLVAGSVYFLLKQTEQEQPTEEETQNAPLLEE